MIKSIHIHPDNVIKIDFWGTDNQSDSLRKSSRKEKGVVLPFLKLGRPIETSFTKSVTNGEKYVKIKKATRTGTYVLNSSGLLNGFNSSFLESQTTDKTTTAGSCSIRFGGSERMVGEPNANIPYLSVFITHFITNPAENKGILRKLSVEHNLSARQISEFTDGSWSKAAINDAIKKFSFSRKKLPTAPCYGERIVSGQLMLT
jgi:hypothetical protein